MSERASRQRTAFYLQYTSLMLIVVCFIVASRFVRITEQSAAPTAVVEAQPDLPDPIGLFDTNLLFAEGEQLNTDIAGAMATFLSMHDVNAQIVQQARDESSVEHSISRLLVLANYFQGFDLPSEAIQFQIQECRAGECPAEQKDMQVVWSYSNEGAQ